MISFKGTDIVSFLCRIRKSSIIKIIEITKCMPNWVNNMLHIVCSFSNLIIIISYYRFNVNIFTKDCVLYRQQQRALSSASARRCLQLQDLLLCMEYLQVWCMGSFIGSQLYSNAKGLTKSVKPFALEIKEMCFHCCTKIMIDRQV